MLKDYDEALRLFRKAIQSGFRSVRTLQFFLVDEVDGIGRIKGTPKWEEAQKLVENMEKENLQHG
jgi:hypothetical protein